MNEKNRKMLELLASILDIDIDKLVDRMFSHYIINLPNKELNELEEALDILEQEEVNKLIK